jgi:ATP-dependent Lhr-like helicase
LHDRTEVLYVSPLKALGNDIQKNLEVPLGEILADGQRARLLMPEIRTAVRTGDTLMKDRRAHVEAAAAHSGDDAGVVLHFADGG